MLKKMRWRFIGAAMVAFSAVILVLFGFVNLWNYQNVTHGQDETLERLLAAENGAAKFPGDVPPRGGAERFSPEVQYMIRFFSVRFDADGNVERVNQDFIASVSEDDAVTLARQAAAAGREHGYLSGYRYLVRDSGEETYAIFLNSERELGNIRSILLITVTIASCCLAVVFVLVLLLSRRAILPYMRNIETQKQFITNASHELKTPLTAISTSADVLAMEHDDDEWVRNIQEQTVRMSKLITNLVTLSRLDEENPFPEKSEFSLSDAVWEAAQPFEPLAKAKGLNFTQNIEGGITLTGDQSAIQQTISVLLDNAMKYSVDGGTISLNLDRTGRKSRIIVTNSCAPDNIPDVSMVFDRFYRNDSSHSSKIAGTGIGLSIARATVEAHGGKISAKCSGNLISFCIVL